MALDDTIHDVVVEVGDARDGRGDLDTIVGSGEPPTVGAAAGASGDAESLFVHFGPGFEVIEGADAVPGFDTGGGVTPGIPPPHAFSIGSVMDALDFAELEGVDDEADVAIAGEPGAVMLVGNLVAVTHTVVDGRSVAAHIEDGGRRFFEGLGEVKVGGDIESREGLEVEIFDGKLRVINGAGDAGFERGTFRKGIEAEHFEELTVQFRALPIPVIEGADVLERPFGEQAGFVLEQGIDLAIAGED
jgi:hypothetical protein